MQRISDYFHNHSFHNRSRYDFGEGDHQEYVESGLSDMLLIGAVGLLLIGGFAAVILG